jgi:hypothetical protein
MVLFAITIGESHLLYDGLAVILRVTLGTSEFVTTNDKFSKLTKLFVSG